MSTVTIVIMFNQADANSGLYPVQLWHESKPLVETEVRLDRQRLLEREYQFSAHDYGMELFDAVFTGALGRAYQRLVGQAGAEGVVRVQLVIHPAAAELHALPWERLFHVFGDTDAPLAASAQTPFSRFLITGSGDQPPAQDRIVRLLVAIANPENLPPGFGGDRRGRRGDGPGGPAGRAARTSDRYGASRAQRVAGAVA